MIFYKKKIPKAIIKFGHTQVNMVANEYASYLIYNMVNVMRFNIARKGFKNITRKGLT